MKLQIIKSIDGEAEYVLLPIKAYEALKPEIDKLLSGDFEIFNLDDYVENPVAQARIAANLTQLELAKRMGVTQAYISKLEAQGSVSAKVMRKVMSVIEG